MSFRVIAATCCSVLSPGTAPQALAPRVAPAAVLARAIGWSFAAPCDESCRADTAGRVERIPVIPYATLVGLLVGALVGAAIDAVR